MAKIFTNFPNGIYQIDSVTATTVVFTAIDTPTGTATVSSATIKGMQFFDNFFYNIEDQYATFLQDGVDIYTTLK